MSEESQRVWSQFQTPPARYAATGDWAGKLKRFAPILRLRLDSSRRALSTHSAILTSLAGKIVRSLPVLKNHRMKRALGPGSCAKSFNCFVSFDLCSSLTATSEPSSENSSPLAISESDSTCSAGELAIETEEPILAVSPRDSFSCRASSTGVAASQSLAVLSQLAVRIRAPSGLNAGPRDRILMVKGGDQLARGRIPEFSACVRACRQDPSTVRTKRRVIETIWMVKGSDQFARGRIPELGGFVCACRQDPSTVRTKLRLKDLILMVKGGEELARGRIPELGGVIRARRQDPSTVRTK